MLKNLVVPCEMNPLPVHEVEIDEFGVRYTANEKMHIQNDTITLNYRLSGANLVAFGRLACLIWLYRMASCAAAIVASILCCQCVSSCMPTSLLARMPGVKLCMERIGLTDLL